MKYTVHAGHNPDDKAGCGAIGYIKESTQNRVVAAEVIALLKEHRHTVIDCTVNDGKDAHDVLEKITSKCNAATADLNISIHFNSGSKDKDSKTTDTEVMIYSASSKAAEPAKRVVVAIGGLNNWLPWEMSLLFQSFVGMVIVTVMEFISGVVLNLWLWLAVWDYSYIPHNVLGQICLPFMLAWFFLSCVAIVLDDWVRHWLFHEERPHYFLW